MGKWMIPAWVPVVVTAGVVFAVASTREVERDYEETFEGLSRDARLVLRHGDGAVVLTPWDRDAVEVRVSYRKSVTRIGFGSHPDLDVEFRRCGDTLEVIGHEEGGFNVGIVYATREHDFVYRIQAPPWLRLELWGDDGDVSIDGFRGELTARLGDGDLTLVDGESDLAILRLGEGAATLRGCRGRWEIHIDEGDLRLDEHAAGRLEVHSEEGDVDLARTPGAVPDVDVRDRRGHGPRPRRPRDFRADRPRHHRRRGRPAAPRRSRPPGHRAAGQRPARPGSRHDPLAQSRGRRAPAADTTTEALEQAGAPGPGRRASAPAARPPAAST
jgi:hypothetical protein